MLNLTSTSLKVFLALDPCDMRKSFNCLHPLASDRLQTAPALFVFTNKRRIKLAPEALQLLIDGVDLRGAAFKP